MAWERRMLGDVQAMDVFGKQVLSLENADFKLEGG